MAKSKWWLLISINSIFIFIEPHHKKEHVRISDAAKFQSCASQKPTECQTKKDQRQGNVWLYIIVSYMWGLSNVCHFMRVWLTALKCSCVTNFGIVFVVMEFICLAWLFYLQTTSQNREALCIHFLFVLCFSI